VRPGRRQTHNTGRIGRWTSLPLGATPPDAGTCTAPFVPLAAPVPARSRCAIVWPDVHPAHPQFALLSGTSKQTNTHTAHARGGTGCVIKGILWVKQHMASGY